MGERSRTRKAPSPGLRQAPGELTDALVLVAKAIVATAISVGLWRQFGSPPALAGLVGLSLFAGLVGLFVLRRGSRREEILAAEVDRLQTAGRGHTPIAPPAMDQPSAAQFAPPPNTFPKVAAALAAQLLRNSVSQPSMAPARHDTLGRVPPNVRSPEPPADVPVLPDPELLVQPVARPAELSFGPAESFGVAEPFAESAPVDLASAREAVEPTLMQPYWSFRDADPHAPAQLSGLAAAGRDPWQVAAEPSFGLTPSQDEAELPAPSPRDAEVEMIQGLIKKMADEVNAAEAQRVEEKTGQSVNRDADDRLIGASLDALRVTAGTMRATQRTALDKSNAPPRFEPSLDSVAPPPATSARSTRAAALAEAIATGGVDVFLDPIMALDGKAARHYEVSIRVRGHDGREIAGDGMEAELRGSGLLPLVDAARIARASIIAGRLSERGKSGSLFSGTSAETLTDSRFFATAGFDLRRQPAQARHLVLTFSQDDVRHLTPAQWRGLADMQDLGLRFALDSVTNLDMDFGVLAGAGFGFVKLRADVFLDGLPSPSGTIPANDICRHLAGAGMSLIVEDIDDEAKLARIFGFGVMLGQGALFGGRRAVKAEAVAVNRGQAAA